jgi:rhodanese-related sulfurtransferase
MKNIDFKVIIIIVAVSAALGIAYNFNDISEKGLSYLTDKGPAATDSLLEAGISNTPKEVSETGGESLDGATITYEQIKARLDDPNFVIIDARSPEEYAEGMIGDAKNIFPYEDEGEYFKKIFTLPQGKKYLIYCTGGNCDLSHKLAEDMKNSGFTNIFIYTGGWEEWVTK